jgi:hypothetical protein
MKLNQMLTGAFAVVAVALGCGCSTSTPAGPARVAQAPAPTSVGTTNLMFAELAAPAPKVGKSHLVVDEAVESTTASEADSDDLGTTK